MSDRITLGASTPESLEPVEVELWERVFVTRPLTRSVEKRIEAIDEQLRGARESDEAIRLFGELLDTLLTPTGSQKKTAGALVGEKWQADQLSIGQIDSFARQVQEAAAQGPRPT